MSQTAIQQAEAEAQATREKAQRQLELDQRAEAEILDKASATVKTIRNVWDHAHHELLSRIGDTPEHRKAIAEVYHDIQLHHINALYNGVQFIDMYNYHMNGAGDWDLGARYVIDDFVRGFLNHAPSLPLELLNIEDTKNKSNPLYGFEPLPVSQLEADPVNTRIPVRVETFDTFYTGYLENFRFTKNVDGSPIQVVTTAPAIRTKENYIVLNAVYRWYPITEELLRQDWENGKWKRAKVSSNPIGATETQPTPEAQNE